MPGRNWLAAPAVRVPSAVPATPNPLPGNCGRSCSRPLGCGEDIAEVVALVPGGSAGVLGFSLTAGKLLNLGRGGGWLVCGTVDVTKSSFSSASACMNKIVSGMQYMSRWLEKRLFRPYTGGFRHAAVFGFSLTAGKLLSLGGGG